MDRVVSIVGKSNASMERVRIAEALARCRRPRPVRAGVGRSASESAGRPRSRGAVLCHAGVQRTRCVFHPRADAFPGGADGRSLAMGLGRSGSDRRACWFESRAVGQTCKNAGPRGDRVGPTYKNAGPRGDRVGPSDENAGPRGDRVGPTYKNAGPRGDRVGPSDEDAGPRGDRVGPSDEDAGPRSDRADRLDEDARWSSLARGGARFRARSCGRAGRRVDDAGSCVSGAGLGVCRSVVRPRARAGRSGRAAPSHCRATAGRCDRRPGAGWGSAPAAG